MTTPDAQDITGLLAKVSEGDGSAMSALMGLIYPDLHVLAARALQRERPDHTLQPTALIHEAYVRLIQQRDVHWQNRAHFVGVAATVMRRILVDHARAKNNQKRGGARTRIALDEAVAEQPRQEIDLEAVDQALTRLAELDARQARIVEMRFFGGLTVEETAEVVGLSTATVKREWTSARAWLRREMDAQGVV